MSTSTSLQALREIIARRGAPRTAISDNGPTFLLAERIPRVAVHPVVNDASLAQTMATDGIYWKTITPYAPWQGAFERLIETVKHSLYKVVRGATVTKDMLETLLVEVEGTLNSRPLTYQEATFRDNSILTN